MNQGTRLGSATSSAARPAGGNAQPSPRGFGGRSRPPSLACVTKAPLNARPRCDASAPFFTRGRYVHWLSAEVLLVVALFAGGLVAFVALARAGWPGTPSRCLRDFVCYCERTQWSGLARQPWNTWSSLVCAP